MAPLLIKRSVYIEHKSSRSSFSTDNSWTILSSLEQTIRRKIEEKGVPLKHWNLNINRGILTGFNDAFIISTEKKDELVAEDPKSAEIIRPILRGRDIKRYTYNFANLWLIATFPSRHYNIDNYPAVKKYLLSYGMEKLEQTGKKYIVNGIEITARKKTSNKWFETQDSISYWNDFFEQKIVYREISNSMDACLVEPGFMLNNKCYLITGDHLVYILSYLNSKLFTKIVLPQVNITGGKGEGFLNEIPLIIPPLEIEEQFELLYKQRMSGADVDTAVERIFCSLYGLTDEEGRYIIG